jgi:tetratricopeptide (TPR) repeat protein
MHAFQLPVAPPSLIGPVKAWSQAVTIPTYLPMAPDKHPMYLDNRVYQGSSGAVYPLPLIDRISDTKADHLWEAIHIENEYIRLMILPQLGGRIHIGLDKTNNYDFFYRQNVIKPALVGLAGPWISGGVEFNWPQHHRPSTFMPVETHIEHHPDGAVTIWCSEHEPMNRMKGMHGICLRPGSTLVELKARLYNRTSVVQTFLWWANVATRVHEQYQSFFPPDVHYVADHAKRAMSRFPRCDGNYYGVNYRQRGLTGVPSEQQPANFIPPGTYPADDLSWYANIPVPTSYMAMGSRQDFFGGYDHCARAGLIHVANHHIAPGKKQWTWGNHEFGYAWDRNLTETDGPYIELMAGVYTDNQPDFSFLHPGETRTWSQYWYPIQQIGPAHHANIDAAISLLVRNDKARIGIAVTAERAGAQIQIICTGQPFQTLPVDLRPDAPFVQEFSLPPGTNAADLHVTLLHNDRPILSWQPREETQSEVPPPAKEPPLPKDVDTNEQLYLIGLHLHQYRHATRQPDGYWREAIRRDPRDSRCHNALGLWHLRRYEPEKAAVHFRAAIAALTQYNPNPYNGEPYYNLGLAFRALDQPDAAYDALYKATWTAPWQSPAFFTLAQIDVARGDFPTALHHLDRLLRLNVDHLQARTLKTLVLRKLARVAEADALLRDTLALDPLDPASRFLAGTTPTDPQIAFDIASDFTNAGFFLEALALLEKITSSPDSGALPMLHYHRAWLHDQLNDSCAATAERQKAQDAPPAYCFPARAEDVLVLRAAIDANPADAHARLYLANLLYSRRRHEEAIVLWEEAVQHEPTLATAWRNLGIGYFNVRNDPAAAFRAYGAAFESDSTDARILYEHDQLWKRIGKSPQERLTALERHAALIDSRDDLSIELATLYNQTAQPEKALVVLRSRTFQPWEGGEGLALGQHVRTYLLLAQRAFLHNHPAGARDLLLTALQSPPNLGEARHFLVNQSDVHYFLGRAYDAIQDIAAARHHYTLAADSRGDFLQMSVQSFSEMTYYSALALQALGRHEEASVLLKALLAYAQELEHQSAVIDYFATSLPTLLLFNDDLKRRQVARARLLTAQVRLATGDRPQAERLVLALLAEDPNHPIAADLLTTAPTSEQTHASPQPDIIG